MKQIAMLCCGFTLLAWLGDDAHAAKAVEANRPVYRHAYYLFLAGEPRGCEECYVPLLLSTEALEVVANASNQERCILITTYERDSIWHDDGIVLVAAGDIEAASRIIELRGRKYRYQEISAVETLRLLMKPMGSIPISRPMLPRAELPGPTLEELIADFRSVK